MISKGGNGWDSSGVSPSLLEAVACDERRRMSAGSVQIMTSRRTAKWIEVLGIGASVTTGSILSLNILTSETKTSLFLQTDSFQSVDILGYLTHICSLPLRSEIPSSVAHTGLFMYHS